MLEIRCSEPNQIALSGTIDELQLVRQKIFELTQSDSAEIVFDADGSVNPAPYNFALSRLIIFKNSSPTNVVLKNRVEIRIEGLPYCLEAFASFFDLNSRSGGHSHYEYYEGNDWISPESIPLVISVK